MKEVTLPSGAILKIDEAPFEDALELNDAVMEELRSVKFSFRGEIAGMVTDALLAVAPSKKVRACVHKCMERCLYNGARMNDIFWKKGGLKREDYYIAWKEVGEENLRPFANSLFAVYSTIASRIAGSLG